MKYIIKIALVGIKRRKAETKALIGMLILVFTFCTLFTVFQESFLRGKAEQRYDRYGEWESAVINAGTDVSKFLEDKADAIQTGTIQTVGDVFLEGQKVGKAGVMDKAMISLGHLSILKGNLPKTEKEVAVEEHVLSRLPHDVIIGSEISLSIPTNVDGSREQQTYRLTGIIKEWGDEWSIGGTLLPDILLGNSGQQEMSGWTSYFFRMLNEEENDTALLHELLKRDEEGTYVYNEKAYPQSVDALEQFFSKGVYIAVILLIAVILIFYAFNISMKKRRFRVQMFRGMGASIGQMACMSLWESTVILVPAFVIGVFLGVLGSWGIIRVASYFLEWNMSLAINSFQLFQSLFLITILFVLSALLLTLYLSGIPLSSSFRSDNGALQIKKVPVLKNVKRLNTTAMSKRNRTFHQKQTYLRVGFSICAVTIMTVSLFLFRENNEKYQFWNNLVSHRYLFHINELTDGIDSETVMELEDIPGVVSVEASKYLNTTELMPEDIKISWDGFKGNEYVTEHRRYSKVRDGMQPYDKEGDYFSLIELRGVLPTDEKSFVYYESAISEGRFQKEKFNEGKECILFLSPYQIRDTGSDMIDFNPVYVTEYDRDKSKRIYTYENAGDIQCGDSLKVSTPWGESTIAVGGIVYGVMRPGESVIAVGEKFLETFFKEDTSKLYNYVTIQSHAKANFAETDWNVEEVFRSKGIERLPTNERIVYGEISGQFAVKMFQVSIILFVIGLLYMLVMYQQNIAFFDMEKRRIGIFRSLGMSKRELKKMYFYDGGLDAFIVSAVSFFAAAIWFLIKLRINTSFDSVSSLLKALTEQRQELKMFAYGWGGVMVFYVLVYWITISNPSRKIMKENIMDSIKEF